MLVGFLRMRPTLRVMRTWRVSSLDTGKLKLNALLGDSIKDLRQHSNLTQGCSRPLPTLLREWPQTENGNRFLYALSSLP